MTWIAWRLNPSGRELDNGNKSCVSPTFIFIFILLLITLNYIIKMNTCNACNKNVKSNERITCSQTYCCKHYHYLCVGLTLDKYKKQSAWICPSCSVLLPRLGDHSETPLKKPEDSLSHVDKCGSITYRRHQTSLKKTTVQ